MKGAIFLDRDGTINANAPPHQYILRRAEFRFLPRARDALAFLAKNSGAKIVICTNQPCVGRREVSQFKVDALHAWMCRQISLAGGRVNYVCVCPHAPFEECDCRKPKPGLFLEAAEVFDLDLSQSVMVGDALSDMQAAWAAGIRECYRVQTGLPFEEPLQETEKYTVVGTLSEAVLALTRKEQT